MPRRCTELVQVPIHPKKKIKTLEETSSLDVSFTDVEALPPGLIFTDVLKKKWRTGKPIGKGSFGRIYLASDDIEQEVTKLNARYVVKIEPHTNGPLFVEIHCLIRSAQAAKVKEWRLQNKQKRLGMPIYIASGSFLDESSGIKYRFLVLPRYDIDLQKIISKSRVLDLKNVLVLAIQIFDVLEYLHNQGYTHSDIKSSNLMLGFDGTRLGKMPVTPQIPSFQKETKQVSLLAGKQRRLKLSKSRTSYYDDEDYIIKDYRSSLNSDEANKKLANVKNKLRKILSDRDNRKLHRHHAFNLRQISNYVNYEDLSSSVCSDQSYQKLLDDFGNKNLICTTKEFREKKNAIKVANDFENTTDFYKEAVLSQSNGHIYLLDYGLASKFLDSEGKHKDFGMDARKAHDGTLEYSSRDSHIGAHSRRSDLETLGYNILDWLTGTLPWKTTEVLAEPDLVHALKKNFMGDIRLLLKTCFKTEFYPQFVEKYLQYVTSLDFTEKPDYEYCRSLFRSELLKCGLDKEVTLNFSEPIPANNRKISYAKKFGKKNTPHNFLARNGVKKAYERENIYSFENSLKLELLKQTMNSSSEGIRKPCVSRNFFISDADLVARLKKSLMPHDLFGKKLSPKNLRSTKIKTIKNRKGVRRNNEGKFDSFLGSSKQFSWAEVLARNPEDIIRAKERNVTQHVQVFDDDSTCKYRIRKLSDATSECSDSSHSMLMQKDYLQGMNPTYAMRDVVASLKKKVSGKLAKESDESNERLEGYTPAMVKVHRIKEKRLEKERIDAIKQQNVDNDDIEVKPRVTRSTRKKVVIEPSTRVTRQRASLDTKVKIENKDTKSDVATSTVKNKKNAEVPSKDTEAVTSKRNAAPKKQRSVKVSKQNVSKTTTKAKTLSRNGSAIPNNRRILRSSKRKTS